VTSPLTFAWPQLHETQQPKVANEHQVLDHFKARFQQREIKEGGHNVPWITKRYDLFVLSLKVVEQGHGCRELGLSKEETRVSTREK
jgi:hypothetical protein